MFIYTRYVKLDTKIHLVLVGLSSAYEGPKFKLNWAIHERLVAKCLWIVLLFEAPSL